MSVLVSAGITTADDALAVGLPGEREDKFNLASSSSVAAGEAVGSEPARGREMKRPCASRTAGEATSGGRAEVVGELAGEVAVN